MPPEVPGVRGPPFHLPEAGIGSAPSSELFPPLPSLPSDPTALPGPEGRPYTLSQLQQLAAANSPELRQAASDVEAARGNMIQARAYPNPTVGWEIQSVERRQRARRRGSLYGPTDQDGRQVETCLRVGRNGFAEHGAGPATSSERLVDPRTKLVLRRCLSPKKRCGSIAVWP